MATFVFDTHRAVKDLEEAGFPEAQAEALVEIVGAAVGENAATKADLDAMEQRVNARIEAVEQRMEARIDALEQRMEAQEQRLNARSADQENRLTIRFLLILLPSLGLLFAALRLLPG